MEDKDKVVDIKGQAVAVVKAEKVIKTYRYEVNYQPGEAYQEKEVVDRTFKKVTGYQVNDKFLAIVQDGLTTLVPHEGVSKIEIKE